MGATPATNRQVPDHSIMDRYYKQCYLGNAFQVSTDAIGLADTTEVAVLSIANSIAPGPTGSGTGIFVNLRKYFCNDVTGATGIVYRLYKNVASISGGTALTPSNCRFGSAVTSLATVKKSPTWTVTGTPVQVFPVGWGAPDLDELLVILDPGNNLMITAAGTAATSAIVDASWYEL